MLPRNWIKKTIDNELAQYNASAAAIEKMPEGHPARTGAMALAAQSVIAIRCDVAIVKIHDRTHSCSDVSGQHRRYAAREACPTLMALVRKRINSVGYDPAWGK